jgi:hypothetical protein
VSVEKSGLELREAYRCLICGATFHDEERAAYSRHMGECATRHHAEIRQLSPREQAPGIFGDEGVDTEYEQHLRRGGRP